MFTSPQPLRVITNAKSIYKYPHNCTPLSWLFVPLPGPLRLCGASLASKCTPGVHIPILKTLELFVNCIEVLTRSKLVGSGWLYHTFIVAHLFSALKIVILVRVV